MKILITNDDGIDSPVLPLLARWASKLGEVTVVAPKVEQSAKSQAIWLQEMEVTTKEIAPGITAYAVDSTPADCVRFGVHWFKTEYDLILSGLNRGYNLGDDIVQSGTCGAIFEGARMGLKGLAVSSDIENLMEAPDSLDAVWSFIQDNNLYDYNLLYNVNIPPSPTGEIRVTKQGGAYYCDTFIRAEGENMYVQTGYINQDSGNDPHSDIISIRSGVISITPLAKTRTEMSVFEKIKNL